MMADITLDQYKTLRGQGVSDDQIVRYYRQQNYKGGATSPANIEAQKNLKKAQYDNSFIQSIGRDVKSVVNPVKYLFNQSLLGIPGITSELLSGGKMVNPLNNNLRVTKGGSNIFDTKDLSYGQKLALDIGSMLIPGAAIAKATGIEKQLGNVVRFSNPKNTAKLADDVDNSLMLAHDKVVKEFGPEYDRIIGKSDKTINLSEPVNNLVKESSDILKNSEFAKTPQAQRVINMVDKVKDNKVLENMSAKEADQLQKSIKQLPSIKTKLEKGYKTGFHNVDWTNEERILLKFSNDIKSKVIDGHDELAGLNKEYGSFMNSYKQVRGSFGISKSVDTGTEGLMKNYHKLPQRFKDEIEKVLPEGTTNKIKDYNNSQRVGQTLKTLGLTGLGLVGLEKAKKFVNQ